MNLCDYSNAYIHGKGTITVANTGTAAALGKRNKNAIVKNYAPFVNCTSDTQVDDPHDFDVVIPMFNLIECSAIYLNGSGSLWQSYRDDPALNNNNL